MELGPNRKRSASHASLYHAPKIAPSRRSTLSNFKPTASRIDPASLLRSPGPLESMLKTTTETGDIGVFSIKPTVPPATFHHAPRSRPQFGDASLLQASRSKIQQDGYYNEVHKRDGSHRDTTSEILSLYGGSESQPSWSASISPRTNDGRRSQSTTTCSTRRIPSQKSLATVQSQCSAGFGQRSRSPYPYPTRLKRPGIRPSSPALTDNGNVDYTRMVELERTSQVRQSTLNVIILY